jgi:hypothetical protein
MNQARQIPACNRTRASTVIGETDDFNLATLIAAEARQQPIERELTLGRVVRVGEHGEFQDPCRRRNERHANEPL